MKKGLFFIRNSAFEVFPHTVKPGKRLIIRTGGIIGLSIREQIPRNKTRNLAGGCQVDQRVCHIPGLRSGLFVRNFFHRSHKPSR